jgi:hypothetical protein
MGFDDLTPEQQEKAKACKSAEELEALAAEEGMRLSADELKALAGGTSLCMSVKGGDLPCKNKTCHMLANPCQNYYGK